MGRRIKAYRINKKYLFIGVAIAVVSLGVVLLTSLSLTSCRNPLMDIIKSSGITVKVDGKAIQPGSPYDLGRVKPGSAWSAIFTIQNSGNVNLELTGDPPVRIIGDITTADMFEIESPPSKTINVKGSTEFTLEYNPKYADAERAIQLLIRNNSKQEDFSFDLTSFVDGTAPTIKETGGVLQVYPAVNNENISTNVTVSVIFSEEMDPDTITTTSFTLTEDPDGAAIPVDATVSYDSDTAFLDPILSLNDSTEYEVMLFNTITDLAGNPMAVNYPWSFTTGVGDVDSDPPKVNSTVPANNATGVALSSVISATFNEPLDSSTAENIDNFIVVDTTAVEGTPSSPSYDDPTRTITFTPKNPLSSLTTYTVQLTTGIKDDSGNPLASTYSWTFTTEQGVDAAGPTVIGRGPVHGAPDVATNIVITAEFDELLDPETVKSNFSLVQDLGPNPGNVNGTVTYNAFSKTAIFTPDSGLDNGAQYRVVLTSGIKDISQNSLVSQPLWTFTAGSSPDSTAPMVDSTNPINGGTGALKYGNITVTFNESMHPGTINDTTFTLYQGAAQIIGIVSYSEATKTATFNPTPVLGETTVYTANLVSGLSGVTDAAGVPLAADEEWTFTTEAGSENPKVIEGTLDPPKNAVDVDVAINAIKVEFDKMMDLSTIDASSFLVSEDATGDLVTAASILYNDATRIATFTLSSPLDYSTVYKVECTTDITDIGTNPLIYFTYKFTTMPDNRWDSMLWDVGKWAP